jgi:GABA(A) receptor-associated protein
MSNFKKIKSLEKRKNESRQIIAKYPDRIPIICERGNNSSIDAIDKNKYLVPSDLTVGQFIYIIRKRINLNSNKALFIFINNTIPPSSRTISSIYDEYKDEDGFIYITYTGENTFG